MLYNNLTRAIIYAILYTYLIKIQYDYRYNPYGTSRSCVVSFSLYGTCVIRHRSNHTHSLQESGSFPCKTKSLKKSPNGTRRTSSDDTVTPWTCSTRLKNQEISQKVGFFYKKWYRMVLIFLTFCIHIMHNARWKSLFHIGILYMSKNIDQAGSRTGGQYSHKK